MQTMAEIQDRLHEAAEEAWRRKQRRPVLPQPICGIDKGKNSMELLRAALSPSATNLYACKLDGRVRSREAPWSPPMMAVSLGGPKSLPRKGPTAMRRGSGKVLTRRDVERARARARS